MNRETASVTAALNDVAESEHSCVTRSVWPSIVVTHTGLYCCRTSEFNNNIVPTGRVANGSQ